MPGLFWSFQLPVLTWAALAHLPWHQQLLSLQLALQMLPKDWKCVRRRARPWRRRLPSSAQCGLSLQPSAGPSPRDAQRYPASCSRPIDQFHESCLRTPRFGRSAYPEGGPESLPPRRPAACGPPMDDARARRGVASCGGRLKQLLGPLLRRQSSVSPSTAARPPLRPGPWRGARRLRR